MLQPGFCFATNRDGWKSWTEWPGACQKRLAPILIIVATSIGANLVIAAIQYPEPVLHDEFSYLLAADTYAAGRLTNPTHPHWQHFETFHILSRPSYMSKYPPGNGLALAVGQKLFGHAIVGSWLAIAVALAGVYWMLIAWLPGKWPLVGCMLLAINVPIIMGWGQTYWGGGVQLLGGALVFGLCEEWLRLTDGSGRWDGTPRFFRLACSRWPSAAHLKACWWVFAAVSYWQPGLFETDKLRYEAR